MKIFPLLAFCSANAGEIVKGNDGRVVTRISKYGTYRKNAGKKVAAEVEPTVDYMAMHNPGLAEELAKIMDSANANDADLVAKKNAKPKRKPPRQLLGSAPKAPSKRGPPKRPSGPPKRGPSVNLKSAAGGMSDQERRREEQRIRDEFEKGKADREFQKVKDYAVKGAIGLGVVVALLGVMIFIRNKLEERAKTAKLAEERAAMAAAEKVKPAEKTPADLKALEDQEVAKKTQERENEKIYDTIDSEDQKKIDELYEKKPMNS